MPEVLKADGRDARQSLDGVHFRVYRVKIQGCGGWEVESHCAKPLGMDKEEDLPAYNRVKAGYPIVIPKDTFHNKSSLKRICKLEDTEDKL